MNKCSNVHQWRELWEKREGAKTIKRYICVDCNDEIEVDESNQKIIKYKRHQKVVNGIEC